MPKIKHKHVTLIKAWADGAQIEKFCQRTKKWVVTDHPTWAEDTEYRIRKAVIFEERYVAFDSASQKIEWVIAKMREPNVRFCFTADGELISVVKLEGK
jgi:hypothetical protein